MRQILIVVLVCFLSACGDSPTRPTPIQPPQIVSYQGVWAGTWTRNNCTESRADGVGCRTLPQSGGLRVSVAQTAANVNANVEIGLLLVAASGVVGSDGSLTLAGQGSASGSTVTITSWRTRQAGGMMTGGFEFTISLPSNGGVVSIDAGLQGVVKTS